MIELRTTVPRRPSAALARTPTKISANTPAPPNEPVDERGSILVGNMPHFMKGVLQGLRHAESSPQEPGETNPETESAAGKRSLVVRQFGADVLRHDCHVAVVAVVEVDRYPGFKAAFQVVLKRRPNRPRLTS